MGKILIKDTTLVNDGVSFPGSVLVGDGRIKKIIRGTLAGDYSGCRVIDGRDKHLLPGIIDEHVHFREPGLTHKADIATESAAAAAGGVTSFMEMPNTRPQTTTLELLEQKHQLAAERSLVNYSFYLGATNDNLDEIRRADTGQACGVKLFMGASTGNMLVDNIKTLEAIFRECPVLIAAHCEDETTIRKNSAACLNKYGENMPARCHPEIRSEEACYRSSSKAVELARKYNSRLHILHVSTARELGLFEPVVLSREKRITAEVCVHHLWFNDSDYDRLGTHIKWNPAIKTRHDQEALLKGLLDNRLDVAATDHAPHTLAEKGNPYANAPSGGPMIQHSLVTMLELHHRGLLSLENIVEKMCHAPARLFQVSSRGYLREGYYADLVLVGLNDPWTVQRENILYKCGWSPLEGVRFRSKVLLTMVNGNIVYENPSGDPSRAVFHKEHKGMRLAFDRK